MPLPKIDLPIYEVKLLSFEKPLKYRPFTVKEKKILLMAVEANDINSTIDALKQIITNCALDPIDVDELPLIDMEILFLHLKARSEGEVATIHYKCINEVDGKKCGMLMDVPVNLLQVPVINQDKPRRIMLSEKEMIGVDMRYSSFNLINQLSKSEDKDVEFTLVANAIDKVFDRDNVYLTKDADPDELVEFLNQLPQDKYEKLKEFLDNSPRTQFITKKSCPKCEFEHEFKLEGLQDFFL